MTHTWSETDGIARVFARRTEATPTDPLAFVGLPPMITPPRVSAVHVSVAFTYDIPEALTLARAWSVLGVPVLIGGPAFPRACPVCGCGCLEIPGCDMLVRCVCCDFTGIGVRWSDDFMPGLYVGDGYLFTSRGCPNRCRECFVPRYEGGIRELPIRDGTNILDSNLLACSEAHVRAVFAMLARQKGPVAFTGGLEAARFLPWHADLIAAMHPQPTVFFAFDREAAWKPLARAAGLLRERGVSFDGNRVACYVLCGHGNDTIEAARERVERVLSLGVRPCAMPYRAPDGRELDAAWQRFARPWKRAAIIGARKRAAMATGAML